MGQVINMQGRKMSVLNGTAVTEPECREEYLDIVKFFLSEEEYKIILCSILDGAYYEKLDYPLQSIVDRYYKFSS
jgi:hypothetical protein